MKSNGTRPMTPQEAVKLHQSGDVAAAAAAYRELLVRDPRNAQLLNLLGVATLQAGKAPAAVDLLRQAVRIQSNVPDFHDNLGSALRASGQPAPAVEAHRKAIEIKPDHASYHFNLANALADMSAHRQAVESYRQAVALRPSHAASQFNLANSLTTLGDFTGAAKAFAACLQLDPNHAQALNNLATIHSQMGDLAAAIGTYQRSLTVRPGHAETLSNLGNVLVQAGRLGEAVGIHVAAVAAEPTRAEAHVFLGVALQAMDRLEAAIAAYREGLRLDPDNLRALTNLGSALEEVGNLGEAEAVLSRALSLDSRMAEAWGNLANCRLAQGDRKRGRVELERALELDPELANSRMNRALLRLSDGDLHGGWHDYEWRFAAGEAIPDRRFAVPAWHGEAMPDGRLLIWREQGLGDELMFASLYKKAMARVGRTDIECDPRLVRLFTRSFPSAHVRAAPAIVGTSDRFERPAAHRHVPAGALPGFFCRTLSGFNTDTYLRPDPDRTQSYHLWLNSLPSGLRVGFCWRSRLITHRRRANYLPSSQWAPLIGMPGICAVNLQYGAEEDELATLETMAGAPLHRCPDLDLTNDLDGLAALMSSLDLVITAPTAIGEMAGALGVPVWRIAGEHDWSQLGSGVRPWYPSMRVFTIRGAGNDLLTVKRMIGDIRDHSLLHG